ncbi:hypothetical protein ACIPUO_06295 [Pectobacterium carotovorum]|uniref:hypothetical protein n=1 Tax=Pectobacterium carotovorum TaxID=554 RepID=UPI003805B71E
MVAGLRVRDETGNVLIDEKMYLGRFLGEVVVHPNTSGSVTNEGLSSGQPFFICSVLGKYESTFPVVTFSGSSMNYDYQNPYSSPKDVIIFYGVF